MLISTSLALVYCVSLAVSLSKYGPPALKVAVVAAWLAFANVTVPGPLTRLQFVVTVANAGRLSSCTLPLKAAVLLLVMVWSGPAFTIGAWFAWVTVICTVAEVV